MTGAATWNSAVIPPNTITAATAAAIVAAVALALALLLATIGAKPAAFEEIRVVLPTGNALWVGRAEIRYSLWTQCHAESGCGHLPKPRRVDAQGDFPVTGVNYLDVEEFIAWVNRKTGQAYRLPTIEEWNLLAGDLVRQEKPRLFEDPRLDWAADYANAKRYPRKVFASGHFGALANGISDLSGSVWEWTATCAVADADPGRCPAYVVAGDHQAEIPIFLRDVYGGGCAAGAPPTHLGFRLIRDV